MIKSLDEIPTILIFRETKNIQKRKKKIKQRNKLVAEY